MPTGASSTRARTASQPWSAISVLAFASDDPDDVAEFEAGWALTMQNLRRGVREPLRPEQARELARSEAFALHREASDGRMVTGEPADVARRLELLRGQAEADEVVLVTPTLDRARRTAELRGDR